tara:strand:+ start:557 stop:964 length:408 start_codon:yes stop_codon:yes gene_type:complete
MPIGYSPKLPLTLDGEDGAYGLTKNLRQLTRQNLKMILLTSPGERIMYSDFGVGLRHLLFENNTPPVFQELYEKISVQIAKWLPIVSLIDLKIFSPEDIEGNSIDQIVNISITYLIIPSKETAFLEMDIENKFPL